MLNMVYKEFVVERVSLLVCLGLAILFRAQLISFDAPLALMSVLSMLFTFGTAAHEDRYQSHILINSLPVTRREIVTAKYVFHILVGLGFIGLAVIHAAVFGGIPRRAALSQSLIGAAVIACFVSVFFPMYYWLGPRFVQIGMRVLFIMLIAVVPTVFNLAAKYGFWGIPEFISSLPATVLPVLLTGMTVILLLASWRASVWLYERKEF